MAQQVVFSGSHDVTASLGYGSMTVKLNTCDLALIDSGYWPALSEAVVVKDPGWTGTVVQVTFADIVDRQTGHFSMVVSATNTNVAVARPAPFNLSDNPSASAVSHFLKEDGSGALVLEDGSAFAPGDYALESSTDTYGYRGLSVQTLTSTSDGLTHTKVTATIFQPGLWPGMSVVLTQTNMPAGRVNGTYVVDQVTTTWTAGTPTFVVEMGASLTESLPTLNKWKGGG